MEKKSQISIEYLVLFAFLSFVLISILSVAFFYSAAIKDRLKMTQVNNFANKIISTAETVFYYGSPSQATIRVYVPDGVNDILLSSEGMIITTQLNSGVSKMLFSSDTVLEGNMSATAGVHYVVIAAREDRVVITS
ncbi:MAG: hypothetical protein RL557_1081 [archaeon]|jgi:uncharacterized protein (UPF0333 family)